MRYKVIGRLGQCYISDTYMDLQTLTEEDILVPRSVITEGEEMYIDIDKDFINIDALGITKEEYTNLLCSELDPSFEISGLMHVMDMKVTGDDLLLLDVFGRFATTGELRVKSLPITLFELKYELENMPRVNIADDRIRIAILFIKFARRQDAVISIIVFALMSISIIPIFILMLRDINPNLEVFMTSYIESKIKEKSTNSSIYSLPDALKMNPSSVIYFLLTGYGMDINKTVMIIDNQQNLSLMSNWVFDKELGDITYNEKLLKGDASYSSDLAIKNMKEVKIQRQGEITKLANSYKPEDVRFDRDPLIGAIHNACLNLLHNYTKDSLFWDYTEALYRQVTNPKENTSVLALYKEFMSKSDNPIEKEYMRVLVRQRYTRESIWHLIFKDMDIGIEGKFLVFTETFLSKAEDIPLFIRKLEMVPAGKLQFLKDKIIKYLGVMDG